MLFGKLLKHFWKIIECFFDTQTKKIEWCQKIRGRAIIWSLNIQADNVYGQTGTLGCAYSLSF